MRPASARRANGRCRCITTANACILLLSVFSALGSRICSSPACRGRPANMPGTQYGGRPATFTACARAICFWTPPARSRGRRACHTLASCARATTCTGIRAADSKSATHAPPGSSIMIPGQRNSERRLATMDGCWRPKRSIAIRTNCPRKSGPRPVGALRCASRSRLISGLRWNR